jgi:uncharacterized membrane protein YqjE
MAGVFIRFGHLRAVQSESRATRHFLRNSALDGDAFAPDVKRMTDRSLSDIAKDLTGDLSELVRSEITLAKTELQENIGRLGTGAGLFGGAGVVGLFAFEFVLLALLFGLVSLGLQAWAAALIVAVVLGIIAAVLAMRGKKTVAGASVAPARAIAHLKTDAQAIKAEVDRARSK